MDKNKVIRSHLSPCRGLEARRPWCRAAARPPTLVITVSVAAALLMSVVLFGVRLTPSGGNDTWVSAGVRDVLNAVSSKQGITAGPLATVPDPSDRLLGGLLSPDFDESSCLSRYRAALYRRPSPHAISTYLISALRRYEPLL
ncbi:unnamed protein product [Urochloa humidicola]